MNQPYKLFWYIIGYALCSSCLASMQPFVPPWADRPSDLTDFSPTLHRPAGGLGRITVHDEGHYLLGSDRIRFFGANIGAASAFPPYSHAPRVAKRYASLGFNVVRFHHLDNGWTTSVIDYRDGRSNELNPHSLDRLDWFIAHLKQEGVYVNLNLLNSRAFEANDGLGPEVASMPWKEQAMLGFFHEGARNLQKEYAQRLLTHTNPYTGLTYTEDPAVAFVEINNEIGLLHMWFEGAIDRLPDRYRRTLQQSWNVWLQSRYATDNDLHTAWGSIDAPLGANLISLDYEGNAWNLEEHQGAKANLTASNQFHGKPSVRVQTTQAGTAGWHVQFNHGGIALVEGQIYTLNYWVRGTTGKRISVSLMQAYDPWNTLDYQQQHELNSEWREYRATFIARSSDSRVRLNFGNLGQEIAYLEIAGVSLRSGGVLGFFPEGTSLHAANIPLPDRSHPGTNAAYLDWIRYLRETEHAYWLDMKNWISAIGYAGIQWGTTIMNSPPSIQSVYESTDSHAYWNHPMFHGNDWDAVNWTVDATAMVNSRTGGVIRDLAWQRIRGLPHNVTEYQHSSPNPYGGDAALFAAVYGSLQDWDGIYLFHYGSGAEDWDRGYFNGYFDIDQHPAHRVNATLAALVFRQFLVAPAQKMVAPAFNPDTELEVIARDGRSWHVGDVRHLDPGDHLPLLHRVAMDVHATGPFLAPDEPTLSPQDLHISDTGEITWDVREPERGWITVNSPKMKAMWGHTDGRSRDFGGLVIAPNSTRLGWSTCAVLITEGSGFHTLKQGARGLIITTGQVENTAMGWKDHTRNSVGNQWGRSPVLAENVRNTITFGVPVNKLEVWALDPDGNRSTKWKVLSAGNNSYIHTGGPDGSLWYEFVILP